MPIVVKIPKKVENALGEEGASELIDFINITFDDHKIDIIKEVELRFESKLEVQKSELKKEIVESGAKLRNEMTVSISNLKNDLTESISALRNDLNVSHGNLRNELSESVGSLKNEMTEFKAEIIKWMFIFWTGTIITLLGGVAALIKILI